MQPDSAIFEKFNSIKWFGRCGCDPTRDLRVPISIAHSVDAAIDSASTQLWVDIRDHALGDLTGCLASINYDVYGTTWNHTAKAVGNLVLNQVMPTVSEALCRISARSLSTIVERDLCRIALHAAYAKRFRRLPDFFEKLFTIYEQGHLPCGWTGDLDSWPKGEFIVY